MCIVYILLALGALHTSFLCRGGLLARAASPHRLFTKSPVGVRALRALSRSLALAERETEGCYTYIYI